MSARSLTRHYLATLALFVTITGTGTADGDGALPTPPRQDDPWTPPKSKVPDKVVSAARKLFKLGLADPRGCEYRAIPRKGVMLWLGWSQGEDLHAWVLPAREGQKQRYAICWDGLLYPVDSIGPAADLAADVRAAIKAHKEEGEVAKQYCPRERSGVLLLLRLGEGNLATQLWNVTGPRESWGNPLLELARPLVGELQHLAEVAARESADSFALRRLRLAKRIVADYDKSMGHSPDRAFELVVRDQERRRLDVLLADQERRARQTRVPAIVIGPGREVDPRRRIAALIERLDEVLVQSTPAGWPISLHDEYVLQALIREGDAAVEPLLDCVEKDDRLTRSLEGEFGRDTRFLPVRDVALVALHYIFFLGDLEPPRRIPEGLSDPKKRKAWAEGVRRHLTTARLQTPGERLFRTLADDQETARNWEEAASTLMTDKDVIVEGSHRHLGSRVLLEYGHSRNRLPILKAESLRKKTEPSLTDLLCKRARQAEDLDAAMSLARSLSRWDPKAARPVVKELTARARAARRIDLVPYLTKDRLDLSDPDALSEYLEWLPTVPPKELDRMKPLEFFQPLLVDPDGQAVLRTASLLFGKETSPWLPLCPGGKGKQPEETYPDLLFRPLHVLAPFRTTYLRELEDLRPGGTFRIDGKRESVEAVLQDGSPVSGHRGYDTDVPHGGLKGPFRRCDFLAWRLSAHHDSAPRFELYWPEKKRDEALWASRQFLKQYGHRLHPEGEISFSWLARPATPEQVKKGLAIFSLAQEGSQTRVVTIKLPARAVWTTLKDRPVMEDRFDKKLGRFVPALSYSRQGVVWQAEEVFVDGKWQRYYGFAGVNRLARAPAGDIEFPDTDRRCTRAGSGFEGRLDLETAAADPLSDDVPFFVSGTPLAVTLKVRNRTGFDRMPPPLGDLFRLRLHFTRATISPRGMLVPAAGRPEDCKETPARPGARWPAAGKHALVPAEETTAAVVDLSDWFDVSRPGFYRVELVHSGKAPSSKETAEVNFAIIAPSRK